MCGDKYEPDLTGYVTLQKFLEKIIEIRFEAINQATELARMAMEKRLDSMNEFRETLRDQSSKFVTRNELLATVVGASAIIFAVIEFLRR
jgi:hypothetical protein